MTLTRPKALLIVLLFWAAVYLPGLGAEELYSTEETRVLPAMEMLKSGDWILPTFGGQEYHNKPPGYNWLIAGTFAITGQRSELIARLPSVAFMLLLAFMLVGMKAPWPNLSGRLIAAVVFLTGMGMINAGRRAEIEAVYVAVTGMAIFWWLSAYLRGSSRWSLWIVPALHLAYGGLVKGPILGVIFYAAIIAVLFYAKRLKDLLVWQHLLGIILILVICLGWVYLAYERSSAASEMVSRWGKQWLVRVEPDKEHSVNWGKNVALSLANLLPWLPLVPLWWVKRFTAGLEGRQLAAFKGCRLAAVVCFVLIDALPATMDRYSLPVYPLTALLTGCVLAGHPIPLPSDRFWKGGVLAASVALCGTAAAGLYWRYTGAGPWAAAATVAIAGGVWLVAAKLQGGLRLALATAAVMAVAALQYATFYSPFLPLKFRPTAAAFNAAVPAGQRLYCYQPQKEPLMFYLREPMEYLFRPKEIDANVRYMVIRTLQLDDPKIAAGIAPRAVKNLGRYKGHKNVEYQLVQLTPGGKTQP